MGQATTNEKMTGFRGSAVYPSQVDLVLLLAGGVEEVHQLDDIAVLQASHDLQFAVLEALVLQHFLDGDHLAGLHKLGLVNHSKAAVPNHLRGNVVMKLCTQFLS